MDIYASYKVASDKIDIILSKYSSSRIAVDLVSNKKTIAGLNFSEFKYLRYYLQDLSQSEKKPLNTSLLILKTLPLQEHIQSLITITMPYIENNQNDTVYKLLAKILELNSSNNDEYEKQSIIITVSMLYAKFGDIQKAIETLVLLKDKVKMVDTLIKIQPILTGKNKIINSRTILSKAILINTSLKAYENKSNLLKISKIYAKISDKEMSLKTLDKVEDAQKRAQFLLKIFDLYKGNDRKEILSLAILNQKNIGDISKRISILSRIVKRYIELGEKEKANELLSRIIFMTKDIRGESKSSVYMGVSSNYLSLNNNAKAIKFLLLSESNIYKYEKNETRRVNFLLRISRMFFNIGEREKAIRLLSTGKKSCKNMKKNDETIFLCLGIADMYYSFNNATIGKNLLLNIEKLAENIYANSKKSSRDNKDYIFNRYVIFKTYINNNELEEASRIVKTIPIKHNNNYRYLLLFDTVEKSIKSENFEKAYKQAKILFGETILSSETLFMVMMAYLNDKNFSKSLKISKEIKDKKLYEKSRIIISMELYKNNRKIEARKIMDDLIPLSEANIALASYAYAKMEEFNLAFKTMFKIKSYKNKAIILANIDALTVKINYKLGKNDTYFLEKIVQHIKPLTNLQDMK